MSDAQLRQLAERAGLLSRWQDYRGQMREVSPETLRALLVALELPCASPAQITDSLRNLEQEAPSPSTGEGDQRAFTVDDLAPGQKLWGLSAQLYALRREGDGGLGDYTSLVELARSAAAHGADALAISPVHAAFSADPGRFSPYSPSSRLFLNAWHVDPQVVPGVPPIQPFAAAQALESAALIDWSAAAGERLRLLRWQFEQLSPALLNPATELKHAQEFQRFRDAGGDALEDHARFEALHARHAGAHWRDWPTALQDPHGAAVAEFAESQASEVAFHLFLQWLADRQLGAAQSAARESGMRVGLINDLAVGTDGGGSHAWSRREELLMRVSVGAPPDELNVLGQNWGLTTFSPRALRARNYEPFRELLAAALRHGGGLRMDHVLGLNRLWLLPDGARATEGAYLKYPLDDLLRVTVEESRRRRAVIVGEDLGTVPADFRARIRDVGIMGLRVLWFQRDHGLFVDPLRWPNEVMATTTTHDLPTVAGWWRGRDLHWRAKLGLFAADSGEAQEREARARDRRKLWDAFVHAGVARGDPPEGAGPVIEAAIRFIARAPSRLAIVPLEDLLGLDEQPNLPGTIDEHPNWRRRLPAAVATVLAAEPVKARLRALGDKQE